MLRLRHLVTLSALASLFSLAAQSQSPSAAPEFLYASGFQSEIFGFRIAPNGAIDPVPGTAFGTIGGRPLGIGATSDGKFLYVAETDSNLIEGFAISPRGRLRSLGATPSGLNPSSVALAPSGKFLYVGNEDANISAYKVHTQTGAITEIPGSPFGSAYSPFQIIVDPTGKYLFAGCVDYVQSFSINQATGELTLISTVPSGSSETWIAVDKTNRFLYAASNSNTGDLYGYDVNPWTGSLTLLSGFPFSTNISQREATSSVSNGFIYIAQNFNGGEIAVYSSDPKTGALAPVSGSPFVAGQSSLAVAVDPQGSFVYSADLYAQSLIGFVVNRTTGALTQLPVSRSIPYPWALVSVVHQ